jgi:hypothetical protein
MNINDLTIGQAKELASLIGGRPIENHSHPWKIGQAYLIRTVTHYYTGRLIEIHQNELVLEKAAWIADTGRYFDALKKGTLNEVEPIIGPCIIARGAIIDAAQWQFDLPEVQK